MRRKMIGEPFLVFFLLCSVFITPGTAKSEEAQKVTLPETGQTGKYGFNDDGTLRKGAAWPDPRFTDNSNMTITDNLTGLMWTKDARNPGPLACPINKNVLWEDAFAHVKCLNKNKYLGYDDWRMPNVNEIASLINIDQADTSVWLTSKGFKDIMMEFYWTSTTDAKRNKLAWVAVMYSGNLFSRSKDKKYPLWPVRGGDVALPGLWRWLKQARINVIGKSSQRTAMHVTAQERMAA